MSFDDAAGGLGSFSGIFIGHAGGDAILSLTEVDSFYIAFPGPTTGFAIATITGVGSLLRFEFDSAASTFLAGPDVKRGVTDPLDIPFFFIDNAALSLGSPIFFGDGVGDVNDDGSAVTSLIIEQEYTAPKHGSPALLVAGLLGATVRRWRRRATSQRLPRRLAALRFNVTTKTRCSPRRPDPIALRSDGRITKSKQQ